MNPVMGGGQADEPGADEDTRLLVLSRREPLAFADLYVRNGDRVLAYFYRRILCPYTSAELAAETFAKAYESRHRYDHAGGTAVAWIFGIAGNLYKEWLRRAVIGDGARRRLRITTPPLVEEDLERIENLVDLGAFRETLKAALADLTPKVREAVVLRVAMDLPYPEVAETLGCSIGAARVRVSRGLDFLIERMETR